MLVMFNCFGFQGLCRPIEENNFNECNTSDSINIEAGGFADGIGETNVSSQAEAENMVIYP